MSKFNTILAWLRESLPEWVIDRATFTTTANGTLYENSDGTLEPGNIPAEPEDALLLASKRDQPAGLPAYYRLVLDLDHRAVLLSSSTEGHAHLVVDVPLTKAEHDKALRVLAEVGVIEEGFARSGIESEYGTTIRLPWVKKGEDKTLAQKLGWKPAVGTPVSIADPFDRC